MRIILIFYLCRKNNAKIIHSKCGQDRTVDPVLLQKQRRGGFHSSPSWGSIILKDEKSSRESIGLMFGNSPGTVSNWIKIEDFRRDNVNKAIKAVHDVIVTTRPQVVFTVSPAANPSYNLNTLFADVAKWCREGWIDVVMPQLYQEIGNTYNNFQDRLTWWAQYNHKAALMVGHGYYKFGDPSQPAAFQSITELERQFDLTRKNKKVMGNAQYSARFILLNRIGITDKLASIYKNKSVIPFVGREVAPAPVKPQNVKMENNNLSWTKSGNVKSVVYYFSDIKKEGIVLAITDETSVPAISSGFYCVTTLNADSKESEPSDIMEKK